MNRNPPKGLLAPVRNAVQKASGLEDQEVAETDLDHQVIIAARAVKAPKGAGMSPGS